jgi:hypothetical protein
MKLHVLGGVRCTKGRPESRLGDFGQPAGITGVRSSYRWHRRYRVYGKGAGTDIQGARNDGDDLAEAALMSRSASCCDELPMG